MERLIGLGMLVIAAGVIIMAAGIVGSIAHSESGDHEQVKAGGIILIGPIPIVFGTDRTMVLLSILGGILVLAALFVWRRG
ncbi:MAG: DUF131 domain-containing protein [Candidatus Methanofastidiosia archaeon]